MSDPVLITHMEWQRQHPDEAAYYQRVYPSNCPGLLQQTDLLGTVACDQCGFTIAQPPARVRSHNEPAPF